MSKQVWQKFMGTSVKNYQLETHFSDAIKSLSEIKASNNLFYLNILQAELHHIYFEVWRDWRYTKD